MKKLLLFPETTFAGHCTVGGSNKVWAACLAREQEDADTHSTTPEAFTEVVYLCVYGAYGAHLRVEAPQRLPFQQARLLWQKKCREKTSKGYQPMAFASFLPSFVYPDGAVLVAANEPTHNVAEDDTACDVLIPELAPAPILDVPPVFRYTATPVRAALWEQVQEKMETPHYGLSEKVNGERCLLAFNGTYLVAYNRKGQRVSSLPQGALPLCHAGVPFVLDGERLPGSSTESFLAFDLLEWDGEPMAKQQYQARMLHLLHAMKQAELIKEARFTPTAREALANSTQPHLGILATVREVRRTREVLAQIQAEGGEGIILRRLAAPADEAPLKYKFQADVDAFAFAVVPGVAGGSLHLGLVRPTDQSVIAIGHVRSGLTVNDIRTVQSLLDQGQFPVFTVRYLPARTIGFRLVEPHTSIRLLRTDKAARECTTDQFGAEKAALLAQARPVPGMIMP